MLKNGKNNGKIREICQSEKVGTMINLAFMFQKDDVKILRDFVIFETSS